MSPSSLRRRENWRTATRKQRTLQLAQHRVQHHLGKHLRAREHVCRLLSLRQLCVFALNLLFYLSKKLCILCSVGCLLLLLFNTKRNVVRVELVRAHLRKTPAWRGARLLAHRFFELLFEAFGLLFLILARLFTLDLSAVANALVDVEQVEFGNRLH